MAPIMTRKALLATCVTGWAPSRILGRVQAGDYRYFDTRFAALAHRGGYLCPDDQPRENTLHAFRSAVEYGYRYLAEVQFRFNRRYDMRAMLGSLLRALIATPRQPERGIRVAEVHR